SRDRRSRHELRSRSDHPGAREPPRERDQVLSFGRAGRTARRARGPRGPPLRARRGARHRSRGSSPRLRPLLAQRQRQTRHRPRALHLQGDRERPRRPDRGAQPPRCGKHLLADAPARELSRAPSRQGCGSPRLRAQGRETNCPAPLPFRVTGGPSSMNAAIGPSEARPRSAVLLVDDQPAKLRALEVVLEPLGVDLVRASSGESALEAERARDMAAILLDVRMPGMDGLETAARLRGDEATQSTPIPVVSAGDNDEHYLRRYYRAGAVDYVAKPFDPEIVRAKVGVLVDLW